MKTFALVLLMSIRLIGLVLIVLGFGFWSHHWYPAVTTHMRLGEFLILLLWIVAVLALRAKVSGVLVATAFVWGFLTVYVGMHMNQWLPGAAHEAIRVIHFVIGLGAIGLAEALGGRIKRSPALNRPASAIV
jgi:hypothetical protein